MKPIILSIVILMFGCASSTLTEKERFYLNERDHYKRMNEHSQMRIAALQLMIKELMIENEELYSKLEEMIEYMKSVKRI